MPHYNIWGPYMNTCECCFHMYVLMFTHVLLVCVGIYVFPLINLYSRYITLIVDFPDLCPNWFSLMCSNLCLLILSRRFIVSLKFNFYIMCKILYLFERNGLKKRALTRFILCVIVNSMCYSGDWYKVNYMCYSGDCEFTSLFLFPV
jgi:hypothetical protein